MLIHGVFHHGWKIQIIKEMMMTDLVCFIYIHFVCFVILGILFMRRVGQGPYLFSNGCLFNVLFKKRKHIRKHLLSLTSHIHTQLFPITVMYKSHFKNKNAPRLYHVICDMPHGYIFLGRNTLDKNALSGCRSLGL